MFGFLKNFLGKPGRKSAQHQVPDNREVAYAAESGPDVAPASYSTASNRNRNGHHPNGRGHSAAKVVEVSIQSILAALPLELQARVVADDAEGLCVGIPLERVLSQLAHGTVKISFGEVRQAAPHLFSEENDQDKTLVPL